MLVHTGRLDECTVHPDERWARVGAGTTWRQVVDAATPLGLAPVCGSAPTVGAVGYLTGGGIGPFARTFGVSSDHVRAIEIVTGQGRQLRVTATEHPDLFWAARGGKATVGVLTAVEIDLVPLAQFYGGSLFFDHVDAVPLLQEWLRMCAELPNTGTTSAAILRLPSVPALPPTIAGRQSVAVRFAWTGQPDQGAAYLQALRSRFRVLHDDVRVRPSADVGRIHADPDAPMAVAYRAALLGEMSPKAVDRFAAAVGDRDNRQSIAELRLLGGAIRSAPAGGSAYCHRDAAFSLFLSGRAGPDSGDATQHAERVLRAMTPWTAEGLLANFSTSDDPRQIRRYYNADTYRRLTAIADRYDPGHVLHTGQVARRQHRTPAAI